MGNVNSGWAVDFLEDEWPDGFVVGSGWKEFSTGSSTFDLGMIGNRELESR